MFYFQIRAEKEKLKIKQLKTGKRVFVHNFFFFYAMILCYDFNWILLLHTDNLVNFYLH